MVIDLYKYNKRVWFDTVFVQMPGLGRTLFREKSLWTIF